MDNADYVKVFENEDVYVDYSKNGYVTEIPELIRGMGEFRVMLHDVRVNARIRTFESSALVRLCLVYVPTGYVRQNEPGVLRAFEDENPLVTAPVNPGCTSLMNKVFYMEPDSTESFESRYIRTRLPMVYENYISSRRSLNVYGAVYLWVITDTHVKVERASIHWRGYFY